MRYQSLNKDLIFNELNKLFEKPISLEFEKQTDETYIIHIYETKGKIISQKKEEIFELTINISLQRVFIRFLQPIKNEEQLQYLKVIRSYFNENNINYQNVNDISRFKRESEKILKRKDIINDEYKAIGTRCPSTELEFYKIMRNGDEYYKYGILIYFKSEIIGILKPTGSKLFLSFKKDLLGRLSIFALSRLITEETLDKFQEKKFNGDWFRININDKKIPIILNKNEIKRRYIFNFKKLLESWNFPELDVSSTKEIYKIFFSNIKEIVNENKDRRDFDLEFNSQGKIINKKKVEEVEY